MAGFSNLMGAVGNLGELESGAKPSSTSEVRTSTMTHRRFETIDWQQSSSPVLSTPSKSQTSRKNNNQLP